MVHVMLSPMPAPIPALLRAYLMIGPAIAAGGFALFALPGIGGSYWSTYFPAVIVLGLGMSVTVAPLTTTVMGAVEQRYAGIASGVNNAVSRAGGLLALAALGIVVAAIFSSNLDSRLDALRVAPTVRHTLDAQRTRLAAAQVPAGLPPAEHAALRHAIDWAFLAAFRAAMLTGAGLAALGALVAALLIEDKAPAAATAGQQPRAPAGAEQYAGRG